MDKKIYGMVGKFSFVKRRFLVDYAHLWNILWHFFKETPAIPVWDGGLPEN